MDHSRFPIWSIFGRDPLDPDRREHYRRMLGDMVVEYLTADPG